MKKLTHDLAFFSFYAAVNLIDNPLVACKLDTVIQPKIEIATSTFLKTY